MPIKLEVPNYIVRERGGKKSNFIVEKPDKHSGSQVIKIKIKINSGKSC